VSRIAIVVCLLSAGSQSLAEEPERVLRAELDVPAPIEAVFDAWATEPGARTFLSPTARVESRVDGAYDVEPPTPGRASSPAASGNRLLVFERPTRLHFTSTSPRNAVRGQRTVVSVEFIPLAPDRTRLRLTHSGWGSGPDWDAAYDDFEHFWSAAVLPRLLHRFNSGAIDWERLPVVNRVVDTRSGQRYLTRTMPSSSFWSRSSPTLCER
jgi:uncharacterized protein YndB with AHSA1/START domain